MPQQLTINVRRYDPPRRALETARDQAVRAAATHVGNAKHRLISLRLVPPARKTARPAKPTEFHATVYDYTNARTLDLRGSLKDSAKVEIVESARQPGVSHEEFEDAVDVIRRSADFGGDVKDGKLTPYKPMPPHVPVDLPDGSRERWVTVGLLPASRRGAHEIVGVDVARRRIKRFDDGAPETSLVAGATCGIPPDAGQATAAQGTPGSALVTVSRGNTVLWEFLAVRPAASSGFWGSGVELRNVSYRGRSVLHQAHVPILNIHYDGDKCGPYRDWQWQEGMIQATGQDVAPGFKLCMGKAKTILESENDTGNFLGVGVYLDGEEVVLVSEMEAGWYRYVSQWRLHANGRIRPRFGFGATLDSCVCKRHHHHVYWRLDFDIGQAKNTVQEFNDPAIAASKWTTLRYETRRQRDPAHKRRWRVQNAGGQGYEIVPGPRDRTAQPDWYGRGDFWAVRHRPNEIDDHPATTTVAEIDRFVNRQPIVNEDVVIWYGAHFTHDVREEGREHHGHANEPDHILGPDLVPYRW